MGSGNWNKNYIRFGMTLTVSICVCIVFGEVIQGWSSILAVVGKFISALTPVIMGIVMAFLLNPIMMYIRKFFVWLFEKKLKKMDYETAYNKSKIPSMIITVILFLGILAAFLWTIIPQVYVSLVDLGEKMPEYLKDVEKWIQKIFAKNEILEGKLTNVVSYIEDNVLTLFKDKIMPNLDTIAVKISSGVIIGVKMLFNFLVGIIVAVYLLASKDELLAQGKKIIYCIFSKKAGNRILDGLSYANSVFGGFINGKIIDSVIIGIICFIFTSAVGMQYAVLISVIVGITNIIPFFGPFIGAVPGALLALMDDPIMLLIFVIWIVVLQQFDGNILGPLILGDSTGISGVWVLIAILVGGDLFGVVGMMLGVPVFACIYAFCAVRLRDGLRDKAMSSATNDYLLLKGFDEETGEPIYREFHEARKTIKQKKRNKNKYLKALKKKSHNRDDSENAKTSKDE